MPATKLQQDALPASKRICVFGRQSSGIEGPTKASGIPGRFARPCIGSAQGPRPGPRDRDESRCRRRSGLENSGSSKQSGVTKTSKGRGGGAASISSTAVESSDRSVSDTNLLEIPQKSLQPRRRICLSLFQHQWLWSGKIQEGILFENVVPALHKLRANHLRASVTLLQHAGRKL